MTNSSSEFHHRVLVIDDNPAIHDDFAKILSSNEEDDLEEKEALLFGTVGLPTVIHLRLTSTRPFRDKRVWRKWTEQRLKDGRTRWCLWMSECRLGGMASKP